MSNLLATKQRLGSARSTQKVIKAMELVAPSKIKKAKDKAVNVDFYFETTVSAINSLYSFSEVKNMLKLDKRADKKLVLVITSDMGLCGAYNANVTKAAIKLMDEKSSAIVAGSKGIGKFNYEKLDVFKSYPALNHYTEYELACEMTEVIYEEFVSGHINDVQVVYTAYINPIVQEVKVIDLFDLTAQTNKSNNTKKPVLSVEPEEEKVFLQLLHQYILSIVYSAILQSYASEHSYRRNSMEAANKNSLELIEDLNLEMNRIRQAMITQEISEIIGGSEALK